MPLVIYEDISEIEEAERIRNLLAEIVKSSHDAIIGMTITGRIQTWNPGAERIYGYTAQEAVGKDIDIVFPQYLLNEKDWILVKVKSGEFICDFETKRVRKDGTMIDVSVTISPIFDRERKIIGTSTIVKPHLLGHAVLENREVLLLQVGDRFAGPVDDVDVHGHEVW